MGRERKEQEWGSGGSVGYPFESWKRIQRADERTDSQQLCVSALFLQPRSLRDALETLTGRPSVTHGKHG